MGPGTLQSGTGAAKTTTKSTTFTHSSKKAFVTTTTSTKTTTYTHSVADPFITTDTAKAGPAAAPNYNPGKPVFQDPRSMKFNLPPHAWSLPRSTSDMNTGSNKNVTKVDHSTRRAIMWYYGGADTSGGSVLQTPAGGTITAAKDQPSYTASADDNYWGFQFLWNPENLQNVLSRNANVVPSILDKHGDLNGLFTAMEALQFTIVIDRRNDFACFKANPTGINYDKFYTAGGTYGVTTQTVSTLVSDLMKKGTMADVEYIYRMINGSGQKGQKWINGLGRETADLAFLSPTAVGLKFGPNNDSLSYVGWIESLNVNHTAFTQDMIPIHTEIQVNFNAFSRVSLASGN
jgi:hypothetical protein